eukprot:NODE_11616_length_1275_cov_4.500871.p1 GENE.NODE_11616_length_1275_cov_4.500871~~NODE_11616_length_1275_cov_4.500871.p1  ORF type:complete len:356 (+),score=100.67 NODE_11616_length_1275_cov_4.500871:58-1068(+)
MPPGRPLPASLAWRPQPSRRPPYSALKRGPRSSAFRNSWATSKARGARSHCSTCGVRSTTSAALMPRTFLGSAARPGWMAGASHVAIRALATRRRANDRWRAQDECYNASAQGMSCARASGSFEAQRLKEDVVLQRRRQLQQMEEASSNPDQVAHIRALMQEVADAEEAAESSRQWLLKQEPKWSEEEKDHQKDRLQRDTMFRQRSAAMIIEQKQLLRHSAEIWREMARVDAMLYDLGDGFSAGRPELHVQDQLLMDGIDEKEKLLENLTEVFASVKEEGAAVDCEFVERTAEHEALQRLLALRAEKVQRRQELEAVEKKVGSLMSKHGVFVPSPM